MLILKQTELFQEQSLELMLILKLKLANKQLVANKIDQALNSPPEINNEKTSMLQPLQEKRSELVNKYKFQINQDNYF